MSSPLIQYSMAQIEYSFLRHLFAPRKNGSKNPIRKQTYRAWLPGFRNIPLNDPFALSAFLLEELECKDLDQISNMLWIMTTQSSANVTALHRQRIKGRDILITEDPKLHLIWLYDKIHIKPIPKYLLSRSFWESYILANPTVFCTSQKHKLIRASALGFLRSYAYLICHESDLRIAKDPSLSLVPQFVTWDRWCLLRVALLQIQDDEVSGRYSFGEIRLTRLNFYAKFLFFKTNYHRTHRQYAEYFANVYGPILFFLGIVSVMLSSMQLAATADQIDNHWGLFIRLYRGFSVLIFLATLFLVFVLLMVFLVKQAKEWKFAVNARFPLKEKRGPADILEA